MLCPVVEAIKNIRERSGGFDEDAYEEDAYGGAGLTTRMVHDRCTYEMTLHIMDVARFRLTKPDDASAERCYRRIYGDLMGRTCYEFVLDNMPLTEVCEALAAVNDAMVTYEEACTVAALSGRTVVLPTAIIPAIDERVTRDIHRLDAVIQNLLKYTRLACELFEHWPTGFDIAVRPCDEDVFECADALDTFVYPTCDSGAKNGALAVLIETAGEEVQLLPYVQLLEHYYSEVIRLLAEMARRIAGAALSCF